MPHVGRRRGQKHVGHDRTHRSSKIHVVTGHIEWESNAPKDVKRFEVIQMHNPTADEKQLAKNLRKYYELSGPMHGDDPEKALVAARESEELSTKIRDQMRGLYGRSLNREETVELLKKHRKQSD